MTFGQAAHFSISSHVYAVHSASWESDLLWHAAKMAMQGQTCTYHGQTHWAAGLKIAMEALCHQAE